MNTICVQKEIKWGTAFSKRINLKFVYLTILLFIFSGMQLQAQKLPNEMWHPGMVVLESGDTLRGNLQYDFKTNLVQLTDEKRIQTFTSQKLLYLSFHCQYFKRIRYFYSIPYRLKGNMNVPVLFEILAEGKITLMTREYVILENNNRFGNPMYRPRGGFYSREILTYDYYFLTDDGRISKYEEKKKDLFPYFGRYEKEMADYMKDRRLKADKQGDLVKIITYYNELIASKSMK